MLTAFLFVHTVSQIGGRRLMLHDRKVHLDSFFWGVMTAWHWRRLIPATLNLTFDLRGLWKEHKKVTLSCWSFVSGPKEWEGVYQAEVGPGQFLRWWAGHLHQLQQERQTQPVLTVRPLTFITLPLQARELIESAWFLVTLKVWWSPEEGYSQRKWQQKFKCQKHESAVCKS